MCYQCRQKTIFDRSTFVASTMAVPFSQQSWKSPFGPLNMSRPFSPHRPSRPRMRTEVIGHRELALQPSAGNRLAPLTRLQINMKPKKGPLFGRASSTNHERFLIIYPMGLFPCKRLLLHPGFPSWVPCLPSSWLALLLGNPKGTLSSPAQRTVTKK